MGFLSTLSRVGIGVLAVYLATACTTPVNDAVVNPDPPPAIDVPIEPELDPVAPPVPIAEPEVPVMETPTVVLPPTVEPEPVNTLVADNFDVTVGSVVDSFLNPLNYVYERVHNGLNGNPLDVHSVALVYNYSPNSVIYSGDEDELVERTYFEGMPGLPGVDSDRSSLRVVSATVEVGGVVVTSDGKNIIYSPNGEVGVAVVRFSVETSKDDIVKTSSGEITISVEEENLDENASEFDSVLEDSFESSTDDVIRDNFRFVDREVSNSDLNLIRFIANNGFSDDSVRAIFSVPEDLSAVKIVTDDILGRLLSVETSLYGNSNFRDSNHGPTFFSFDYSGIMRQASFIIPTLVDVDRFNKRIHYDKVDIDELFPSLGGNYAGLFSRGETYNPIFSPFSELSEEQQNAHLNIGFTSRFVGSRTPLFGLGPLDYDHHAYNDNGVAYATRVLSDDFNFNELSTHFSMISLLDYLGFTVGNPLTSKSVDEINLMFGDRENIFSIAE